jgi:very-short-patch-repair endonuclease
MERARRWAGAEKLGPRWCACQQALDVARDAGLSDLVERIVTGEIAAEAAADALEVGYARWWIDAVVDAEPALRGFVSERHEETIARFRKADERVARLSRAVVARRLGERIPPRTAFGSDVEFGLLNHEISKKKRHLPLRQLFSRMPNALQKIAPCMMMSPLSIAQFLPAEAKPFDEASQIPVWDAVGAIARGAQVIVAGDPKQLPPTSFFDRSASDDGDADDIEDLESILDECLGASVPFKRLAWHYRSRRESLIAFSNERYYDGQLVTFPAPETQDRAVRYVHVPDGVYERGGGRVNRAEAQSVVDEVTRRLLAAGARESLGVVTFNSEQQRLIENLLDAARRAHPSIEPFFASTAREPVFVKNLESVQGDERDVILFSVGYGPDASGRVAQNFGPLNRDGGPRRLNVAITRARSELLVFATLRPEQIDLSRSRAAGVRDFKHFLEFAERGAQALAQAAAPLDRDADSDFEREVRAGLEAQGWSVHPQVGVSGLRIDLGVVHPQAPGRYLAGVECDGATYHRSATARDRDRLRQAALENLGWRILRVWSTDWWMDREGALARLDGQLQAALAEEERLAQERLAEERLARERRAAETAAEAETIAAVDEGEAAAPADGAEAGATDARDQTEPVRDPEPVPRQLYAESAAPARVVSEADPIGGTPYVLTDLAAEGWPADRERFYETVYRPTLRRMAALVIEREGPIFEDCLVARIAAAHGFARAAGKIRATIVDTVERRFRRSMERDGEDERKIYWPENADRASLPRFRPAPRDVRDHSDIPLVELASLAVAILANDASEEEAVRRMAETFKLGSLRAATRARFEEAVRLAQEQSDQTQAF